MRAEELIAREAGRAGIDALGITSSYDGERIKSNLIKRKNSDWELEFEHSDIGERIAPEKLLEGYKSIIAIAVSYNFEYKDEVSKRENIAGVMSKSSLGADYHEVLREKAQKLMEVVTAEYPSDYYIGVDTSPLLDREIAVQAGVGYFGKNTSVINEEFGSTVFLGYILTELELEPSPKLKKDCGRCEICVKACPTGAIQGDYSINPKLCVAYLTQTKQKIPYHLRDLMGFKIYGCDVCQNVCPANRGAKKGNAENFRLDSENGCLESRYVEIERLLQMTNAEFKETYGKTASGWRGKNVLKRNAIIALGNSKIECYADTLRPFLKDQSRLLREYALWSLLKLKFEDTERYIEQHSDILDKDIKLEYENIVNYREEINGYAK